MELLIDQEFRSLIPPLSADELVGLEQSLVAEGNRVPIDTWNGYIIDGHNRYDICHKHNIPLKQPNPIQLKDRDDVQIWIIRNQFGRRNLNLYQRSKLVLKLESLFARKGKENQLAGLKQYQNTTVLQNSAKRIDTREELAKAAGVSHDTIAKVKKIEEKASEGDKEKLRKDERTINQIYIKLRRDEKRETLKTTKWPSGKYRIIYADPPWQYDNHNPPGFGEQSDHYSTLAFEQLKDKPVQDIALTDSILFLWSTCPILPQAIELMSHWGFVYKTQFVWDKVKHVMGHYNSVRHEILLIGTKGSCQPDTNKLFDSVYQEERTEHSKKPSHFRKIIDELYPNGPRIELFSREIIIGWDRYGDDIS